MKRKDYKKPTAKVVAVKRQQPLLAGSAPQSNVRATMNGTFVEEDI